MTYCAREGKVRIKGVDKTLLVAPMESFYSAAPGARSPGKTQMRIAYVEPPEIMAEVPHLFAQLLQNYTNLS